MKYLDCPLKYIVQTRRGFSTKYKEHLIAIRNTNGNSGYTTHVLSTHHTYGAVTGAMDIITTGWKRGKC
jgi:hypothetical protein